MYTVEIDFEVYKALTLQRESEEVSYNDVIRRLLRLTDAKPADSAEASASSDSGVWISKGVRFPSGTEFRASYKGVDYSGVVKQGGLIVNEKKVTSPSDAARVVTNTNVNGWSFWECRFPGETKWKSIKELRSRR